MAGKAILNKPECKWRPGSEFIHKASDIDQSPVTECSPPLPHLHPPGDFYFAISLLGPHYSHQNDG